MIYSTSSESQHKHTDRATTQSQQTEQLTQDRQADATAPTNKLQALMALLDSQSRLIHLHFCMANRLQLIRAHGGAG